MLHHTTDPAQRAASIAHREAPRAWQQAYKSLRGRRDFDELSFSGLCDEIEQEIYRQVLRELAGSLSARLPRH